MVMVICLLPSTSQGSSLSLVLGKEEGDGGLHRCFRSVRNPQTLLITSGDKIFKEKRGMGVNSLPNAPMH